MFQFVIMWLVLCSAVVVQPKWECACDEIMVPCSIYDSATVMKDTLDGILPNGNLLISPIGLWVVLTYVVWYTKGQNRNDLVIQFHRREHYGCDSAMIRHYYQIATGQLQNRDADPPLRINITAFFSYSSPHKPLTRSWLRDIDNKLGASFNFITFTDDYVNEIRKYYPNTLPNFMRSGDVTAQTQYVILSMVKFNAQWKKPFTTKVFSHDGKRYTMMHADGDFHNNYDRSRDTSYLHLEFMSSDVKMVIALTESDRPRPSPHWDFYDSRGGTFRRQSIAIPKFTFEVEYSLKEVVEGLGLDSIFKTDFNVLDAISKVSQVVQRSKVTIDEDGVTFEAYTALVGDPSQTPRQQTYEKKPFFKPFVFYLFAYKNLVAYGRVMDPTY